MLHIKSGGNELILVIELRKKMVACGSSSITRMVLLVEMRCNKTVHFITIATTGNAQDFGDCVDAYKWRSSDSHGGLGGF